MTLACGTCTHWILWTVFPAATPWAVVFGVWFAGLALLASRYGVRWLGVPRTPLALVVLIASLAAGIAWVGPIAGFWLAPSCIAGTADAGVRGKGPARPRRIVVGLAIGCVCLLGFSWWAAAAAARRLSPAERVLTVEHTPAASSELRRIAAGDCPDLWTLTRKAESPRLRRQVQERFDRECRSWHSK